MEEIRVPQIAIVGRNMLANIGLASLLQDLMPMANVNTFTSTPDMIASGIPFFHYFITLPSLLSSPTFYAVHKRQSIILCFDAELSNVPEGFRALSVELSEKEMARALVGLQQAGHSGGKHLPNHIRQEIEATRHNDSLTPREIEVLRLIVCGAINKEIADKLGVALTTIISHRKNLTQKLNIKSVSGLTLYAVLHGYIQLSEI
ncbi:MAG: LuxR C-terminal-related transcriptional regulator [Bacteroidaceae bacterium]